MGIDIGKRRCVACLMGRDGTVLEETGYENAHAAAAVLARRVKAMYGKCQAVCESTGNLWIKTHEALENSDIPTVLANLMKVRAIPEASVKTGARTPAHLLRTNPTTDCHAAGRGTRTQFMTLQTNGSLVTSLGRPC